MEFAFITSAVRRYWWLVVLGAVGGLLAAMVVGPTDSVGYSSRAVLLLQAPSDARQAYNTSDPDRYVKGQLNVLNSEVLAQRVAERVSSEMTPEVVSSLVTFTHEPLTDVVHVVVTSGDPELSQAIGNAYLDIYFESLRAQVEDTQRPEIESLDDEIAALRTQLTAIDDQIEDALRPFRDREQVPTVEQVAPGLASQKGVLLAQYNNLLETKNELNTNARLRVSSEIVQRATLPTLATTTSSRLFRIAAIVAGALGGAFGAIVMARLSTRVLGDGEVRELIGHPIVGRLPYQTNLRASSGQLIDRYLPDPAGGFVQKLCVRAEATGRDGDVLTVLVVGAQRGAGTTTLATVMARRYAEAGRSVLLVDADLVHRGRPIGHGRPADAGVVVASGPAAQAVASYGRIEMASIRSFTGSRRERTPFELVKDDALGRDVDVVIFDGGPLLESSVAVVLARNCDAVVVAVPDQQDTAGLDAVGQELDGFEVLPVTTMRHQVFDRLVSWWRRRANRASRVKKDVPEPPRPPAQPPTGTPSGPGAARPFPPATAPPSTVTSAGRRSSTQT